MNLAQNYKLANVTKILNFLLAFFKKKKNLERAIYELNIKLKDGTNITPDLFCLIEENKKSFYCLFEFKKRTKYIKIDVDDRIRPQYLSYLRIEVSDLDDLLIPRIQNSERFINYLFHDSDHQVIDQIIKNVPIDTNVYHIELDNNTMVSIQTNLNSINYEMMQDLVDLSKEGLLWNKIYIPFTFQDIQDIRGKNGNRLDIHNRSAIILTNNLMMFLFSRKIKKESNTFRVDDFINYVFQNNFQNLNIGWEYRSSIDRKFRLFLNFFCKELPTRLDIKPIIEKEKDKFRINMRQTKTFEKRLHEITTEVLEFLKQKRISDYFE